MNNCCAEIMVVDDIDYNRFAVVSIMETMNLNCIEAVNGQDCIDQVTSLQKKTCCKGIRLIIMDYDMPILNGLEAAKKLSSRMTQGELKRIPIVALTCYNGEKEACK